MERLKAQNPDLKDRVTDRDATIEELTEFKEIALARLAAQHDEIMRLRSPQSFLEPAPPADRPPPSHQDHRLRHLQLTASHSSVVITRRSATSWGGRDPLRRTGHRPKYIQYEGLCPARRGHAPDAAGPALRADDGNVTTGRI
ncbi:hypothetical protein [Streptomyces mirabilis]|uniref:hypothetical protein n=1 Tax=Streptomyces mirabilis TaxID=68239 RepID=UPI0022520009|nr:hypothetical protein [Streptomyces mirabilis]MCX4418439.1 hypothetical protein [Streptomyces mirabilis]